MIHQAHSDAIESVMGAIKFGSCGRQRDLSLAAKGFDAEVAAIYILRLHQGLGRAMMSIMASTLRERAHQATTLWVLRENEAARRFYEHLGGIFVAKKAEVSPDAALVEVAYGWCDRSGLVT